MCQHSQVGSSGRCMVQGGEALISGLQGQLAFLPPFQVPVHPWSIPSSTLCPCVILHEASRSRAESDIVFLDSQLSEL